jgi:UDP-glucose 4-epimerase
LKSILVTGGAGYLGSHTLVALAEAGFEPVVLDDFSNSSPRALDRVREILQRDKPIACVKGDVRDTALVASVLKQYAIEGVIHFAGLKSVAESVANPLAYMDTNVGGSLNLLKAMRAERVHNIVFSSSATVYGLPDTSPVPESAAMRPSSPYALSKLQVEQQLSALCESAPEFAAVSLRYFNPCGAHPSGQIGEDPRGVPNNLMPFVAQVAVGRRDRLAVFGQDYDTPDGTGVRDYVHVMDLAYGHVAALSAMKGGHQILNLGTGRGHSVLEVRAAFEAACGREIPFEFKPRRDGDVAIYFADPRAAEHALGWCATRTLAQMCEDAWHWQQHNPMGYERT